MTQVLFVDFLSDEDERFISYKANTLGLTRDEYMVQHGWIISAHLEPVCRAADELHKLYCKHDELGSTPGSFGWQVARALYASYEAISEQIPEALREAKAALPYNPFSEYREGQESSLVPTCVRWLGAYGKCADAATAAEFEASPGRDVSAEGLVFGVSSIKHTKVGLLVDTSKTPLVRAFAGDAYTPHATLGEVSVEDLNDTCTGTPSVTRWGMVASLVALLEEGKDYIEVMVSNPIYSAVVYREGGYSFAVEMADLMGLPLLPASSVEDQAKYEWLGTTKWDAYEDAL